MDCQQVLGLINPFGSSRRKCTTSKTGITGIFIFSSERTIEITLCCEPLIGLFSIANGYGFTASNAGEFKNAAVMCASIDAKAAYVSKEELQYQVAQV